MSNLTRTSPSNLSVAEHKDGNLHSVSQT